MTSNIISNFWRENSKRNFFDDFDTLCSSPDFVSFGHLAQIVCTSLAENEWYKKSFAWQSQGRKGSEIGKVLSKQRSGLGPSGCQCYHPLTEWIQSCIRSVIEVWIVFTIQDIHSWIWLSFWSSNSIKIK